MYIASRTAELGLLMITKLLELKISIKLPSTFLNFLLSLISITSSEES